MHQISFICNLIPRSNSKAKGTLFSLGRFQCCSGDDDCRFVSDGLVSNIFDVAYPGVHGCISPLFLGHFDNVTRISWICFIVRVWSLFLPMLFSYFDGGVVKLEFWIMRRFVWMPADEFSWSSCFSFFFSIAFVHWSHSRTTWVNSFLSPMHLDFVCGFMMLRT